MTLTPATVTSVVDGNTLKVVVGGQTYTVRIIGVDTPETKHPTKPVMCFGAEATAFTQEMVNWAGGRVLLEKDVSETDRYDRLLLYAWLAHSDGRRMPNQELVAEGYAQVSTYPPDVRYQELFLTAQREAREQGCGLWGACSSFGAPAQPPTPVPAQPTPTSVVPPPPTGGDINHAGVSPISAYDCPADYPVKGNTDSGIYHTRSSRHYDRTKPEVCFNNAADAEVAGFRAPKQ